MTFRYSREGWARDGISEKFDHVTIIDNNQGIDTINLHQETITINIPSRFSPYYDHRVTSQEAAVQNTAFEITGVLLVPSDGKVYYTSDRDAFKSGDAKTSGLYFYYDSDSDSFYETVYVLAPDLDNDGVYDVMSIGYNSDNEHDFAPYEKITINEPVINRDDYKRHVSTETAQYGNWVYNFARLDGVKTLFPKEIYDGYEPKDDLFEIWKLVKESDQNYKFSQLFYEVRHKEYDKTSNDYYQNFERDIGEQVFATLVASGVSMAITAISLGTATLLAHAAYIVIYATISKFQMDMKAREAEAMARSTSFLPEGIDRNEPTSLNQKITKDEFWGDSMPTALSGHPGAYYTTVMGGEVGAQYTAQAIVSPPNDARFWNSDKGMLGYLENNLFTLGHGDPDFFTELDFDNHNLDYLLVSSELYAYNDEEHIIYVEDPSLIEVLLNPEQVQEQFGTMITAENYVLSVISTRDSYAFRQNTLGYITKEVRQASNGSLTTIKATCVEGQPRYVFTTGDDVVPESTLYKPLIVSPDRYEELKNQGLVDGYIVIDVQASDSTVAQGIDSSKMTITEKGLYSAKIPLADTFGGFNYPIKSVIAYEMDGDSAIDSHLLTTSNYTLDIGNLYFYKSLEELVSSPDNYLKFVIQIAKIIPDDGSEEIKRDALNIATTYATMDYFDQYTFAQTTAQMIAEIGYTEIMTVTSMAISAPFIALGSYAVGAYIEASAIASTAASKLIADTAQKSLVQTMVSQFALKPLLYQVGKQVVIGTIKETIEEIVVDGFFETAIQSAVRMVGGPNDMGHWISTLFTSARESMNFASLTGIGTQSQQQGFAGQVQTAMGQDVEFLASVMDLKLQYEDDVSIAQVATANEQFLTAKMNEFGVLESSIQETKISVGRLLATGIFTGLAMLTPSLAGFNLYGASKLIGGIGGKIDAKIQNQFLAARNSKMLLKSAEDSKKQEVELGKKHVDPQSENIKPAYTPEVSPVPQMINPLYDRPPIELEIGTAVGAVSSGFVYMSEFGDPNRDTRQRKLDPFIREKEAAKSQKVKDHLAKIEEMKNTEEDRDKDIVEQQEEKKQQIFDDIELFGFDPQGPDLKYKLTERDNLQATLFKTLLNIIYENQKIIENVYKNDNTIGLNFWNGATISGEVQTDYITPLNLGVILGLSRRTMYRYLKELDNPNQDLTFHKQHEFTIRKIRDSLKQTFGHINLREGGLIIESLIDNYISLRYSGNSLFVMKFLTILDDNTDFDIESMEEIGTSRLGQSFTYLNQFMTESPGISKIFNFIVNLYIRGESNLGFSDSSEFFNFKMEITKLAYETLVNAKLVKGYYVGGLRFYAISRTLVGLTKLRLQNPATLAQYINKKNPNGYFTYSELAAKISPKDYAQLLLYQLKDGTPSYQLGKIKTDLNIGALRNIQECTVAINMINNYLRYEKKTNSMIGRIIHSLYESITRIYLKSKGIRSAHEVCIYPPRKFRIDSIIERSLEFRKYIEASQSIVSLPNSIKLISVDYTFSGDLKWLSDKLEKHYQSDDRFLLIVLLGQKNDNTIRELNTMLQDARENDDGSKHLDHVQILTSEEYKEFLGFDEDFEKIYNRYEQFSFNIFHSNSLWSEIRRQSEQATNYLDSISDDWIKTYFP